MQRVNKIEKKVATKPSKEEKYRHQLEQLRDTLLHTYEKRLSQRMDFLERSYTDLFLLNQEDFTRRHARYCSRNLLQILKSIYMEDHCLFGYSWSAFTDNIKHLDERFRITYLQGDPEKAGSKEEALFMFGDSIRHPEPKYRFSGEESKWFQVSFAENHVMVQVDGQDDRIVITGLINPRLKLFIKHTLSEEAQKTL